MRRRTAHQPGGGRADLLRCGVCRYHPDKNNGSKDAERMFIQIQQAYEVLKDEKKRSAYDAARRYSSTRSSSSDDRTQRSRDGQPGDAFSFFFNGREMTFEDLAVLLKQWEQQAPIDISEATRRFQTFVDVRLPPALRAPRARGRIRVSSSHARPPLLVLQVAGGVSCCMRVRRRAC
eukprot:Tamp_25244.p2 GENE.Tamp_25244~~Tamp_25244.p2  ORF type:complete len:177 (-),score=24.22 Tamp_25244:224-754(-)